MRKFQNIVSTFGFGFVRQGNELVVGIESVRSLCASSYLALHSYSSRLASWLAGDAWQGPAKPCNKPRVRTAACITTTVVTQAQRGHEIMCHRAAA